ncbi:MAG: hypothetical protein EOM88_03035 [Clostridia bacterium]|nr:hypothetical protein [Clostridia bacterium]
MKKIKLLLVFALLGLSLSACTISVGSKSAINTSDGGLWASGDRGKTWKQVSQIPTVTGKAGSIGGTDIYSLEIDPQDSQTVYLGTAAHGMFYTYNIADGWWPVKALGQSNITDIKVDPKNKCVIYTAITNRLLRSNDCGRTWQQVYYDNNPEVAVTSIAIDHYNSDNVYISTSRGEIIKSIDQGISWRTIKRLGTEVIKKLLIYPQDSRLIFVATNNNRIYSFRSNTITNVNDPKNIESNFSVSDWRDLGDVLSDFKLGDLFRDIIVSSNDGVLLLATSRGIVRSPDQGITWESIDLLPDEKDAIINAIAISPKNSQEIYYVTNTAFFGSTDGGVSWSTKKLSTSRIGWKLKVNYENTDLIYLGTRLIQTK